MVEFIGPHLWAVVAPNNEILVRRDVLALQSILKHEAKVTLSTTQSNVKTDALSGKDVNEGENKKEPRLSLNIAVLDVELPKLVGGGDDVISADSPWMTLTASSFF
jgi:hypothetical protein